MEYKEGKKSAFTDVVTDSLVLPGALSVIENYYLRSIVFTAVRRAEKTANIFVEFVANVARASGCAEQSVGGKNRQKIAQAKIYGRIDPLFRQWLRDFAAHEAFPEVWLQDWTDQLKVLAFREGEQIVQQAPSTAWAGRERILRKRKEKQQFTLGLAEAWFRTALHKELPSRKDNSND